MQRVVHSREEGTPPLGGASSITYVFTYIYILYNDNNDVRTYTYRQI